MGYILLLVLFAVEVSFFSWSLWTKEMHTKEKSITYIGMTLLFILGFSTGLLSFGFRYYLLLLFIVIKLGLSMVRLIKKRRPHYKSGKNIRNLLLNTLSLVFVLIPAILFPQYKALPVSGPHTVEQSKYTWIDHNRIDTYEKNEAFRALTVEFWYPSDTSKTYPLVVFSHGAFGYSGSNYSTFMALASNGYVVASIGHTHQAFFTKDTSGKLTIVDQGFIQEAIEINAMIDTRSEALVYETTQAWMKLRTEDTNFVLDTIISLKAQSESTSLFGLIDTTKIGVFGHSLGGASAAQIGRIRNDIDAVIVLDGTMLGEEVDFVDGSVVLNDIPYPVPLLNVYAEDHYQNAMTHVGDYYNNFYASSNAVDAHETVFLDAGHLNFTDLPLFSPILAGILGVGSVDEVKCIEQMNDVVLSFFDYYLKTEGTLEIKEAY
jgi:predicted dienelactone hydrolase